MLSHRELRRYDRQIILEGIGVAGQEKLKACKVFVAGAGGLGCPISIYLATAGVGTILLSDSDVVELSNLNRQILHWDKDVGTSKAGSAREKLQQINPDVTVETVAETIEAENVNRLVADCDVIVDAMDNFPTRYLLNRAAIANGIPFFHGAVYGLEGRAMTVIPHGTACLRCLYPQAPPAEKFPVLGVTPGLIGCIQATEVIKFLVGVGKLLTNRLLVYDGLEMKFSEISVARDPHCPDCG